MKIRAALIFGIVTILPIHSYAEPPNFTYRPPGELVPGSGQGRKDTKVYAANIRFPIQLAPAFANSQVWGKGGQNGGGGSQCDAPNYSYPWRDNYCETRPWKMTLCPTKSGHQGQDIRPATCQRDYYWVVAVVNGTIVSIGSYSVYLAADDGTRFDYLHMSNLQVKEGQHVLKGEKIGQVSNVFNTPTTIHLHFNILQNVQGLGLVFVPPYMSLVKAYEQL